MQIIILGMHRSGTSMVTRLINMLGAYIGPERQLLEYRGKKLSGSNAKGHFERQDVMDINDTILKEHNAKWDMPVTDTPLGTDIISDAQREAIKLCLYGLDTHRPWVMKDPRLCLTLPYWLEHMEVPLVIIVTRNPEEIATSLQQRNRMPIEKGMALWEYYMSCALNATLETPRFFVDYQDMLIRPNITVEKLYDWLVTQGCRGLTLPSEKELHAFVDPSLYRAKTTTPTIGFSNTNPQRLWQILSGTLPQVGHVECSDSSRNILLATTS